MHASKRMTYKFPLSQQRRDLWIIDLYIKDVHGPKPPLQYNIVVQLRGILINTNVEEVNANIVYVIVRMP